MKKIYIIVILFLTFVSIVNAADKTWTAGENHTLTDHVVYDNAYSTATASSWATVIGAYNITIDDITDVQYVSFQNTGTITISVDSSGDYAYLKNCIFYGQSSITIGTASTTPLTSSMMIDQCDFRNQTTDNFLTITGTNGSVTGEAYIRKCTLDQTEARVLLIQNIDGFRIEENILNNVQFGNVQGSNWNVAGGLIFRQNFQTADSDATVGGAGANFKYLTVNCSNPEISVLNNYWYMDVNNPHPLVRTSSGDSDADEFIGNIFEVDFNSDGANILTSNANRALTANYNILIGSGSLINNVGSSAFLTITGKNNTCYGTYSGNDGDGLLFMSESGPASGTINLSNNLMYGNTGDAINSITGTQTITSSDYNWFYNFTNNYDDVTVSSGQGNDTSGTDPNFVDATRNLTDWYGDRYSDGTPTKAEAVEKLLLLNGYNSTSKTQSDTPILYDQNDLILYVKAGFVAQAAGIHQGGESGEDIGALDDEGWNAWGDHSIVKNRKDGEDDTSGSSSVSITIAKNEFEAVQVFAYADSAALENVDVIVSPFLSGSNSIDDIYVHKETYINCSTLSRPDYAVGYYPDILIPKVDIFYNEYRSQAFPVDVLASDVQGFWVEFGTTTSTVEGDYTGTITVIADGKAPELINITITVYDFAIPSTATYESLYATTANRITYGHGYGEVITGDTNVELIQQYRKMFLYHRASVFGNGDGYSAIPAWDGDTLTIASYEPWETFNTPGMNGTAITTGPYANAKFAALNEHRSTYIDDNSSVPNAEKEDANRQYHQLFYDKYDDNGWEPFTKMPINVIDEPRCDSDISFRGSTVDECTIAKTQAADANTINTGGLGTFEYVYTHTHNARVGITDFEDYGFYSPNFYAFACDNEDKDCSESSPTAPRSGYTKDIIWPYLACDNNGCDGGSYPDLNGQIDSSADADPMYNRMTSFLMWKYEGTGTFYWGTDVMYYSDPYNSIYNTGSNGDGHLLYPGIVTRSGRSWSQGGTDGDHTPAIGGTHDIPIASMRWKYIRDWQEDLEYMELAEERTSRSAVLVVVDTMFSVDNIEESYWNLNMNPEDLLTARENIANLIMAIPTISGATISGGTIK